MISLQQTGSQSHGKHPAIRKGMGGLVLTVGDVAPELQLDYVVT
jgi:hypothetical protein